jgi:hypothetical protein
VVWVRIFRCELSTHTDTFERLGNAAAMISHRTAELSNLYSGGALACFKTRIVSAPHFGVLTLRVPARRAEALRPETYLAPMPHTARSDGAGSTYPIGTSNFSRVAGVFGLSIYLVISCEMLPNYAPRPASKLPTRCSSLQL